MARLSANQRKKIPQSKFGIPSKAKTAKGKAKPGSFPIPDKNHARAALRLIGHAPANKKAAIRAKANKMLGKKKGK